MATHQISKKRKVSGALGVDFFSRGGLGGLLGSHVWREAREVMPVGLTDAAPGCRRLGWAC
jgi:hypothetical protein